jgi:16S rRNA (cytosine967-C5)-methyltransferase
MSKIETFGARYAALEVLGRFRKDGTWSSAGIDSVIKKYDLSPRDTSLTTRLSLGVLQNSLLCDYYIDYYSNSKLEPKVRDILRLGVYQLLFMDKIPSHAAVSESVALCKESGFSRASGLVNAILRRVADNLDNLPEIQGKGSAKYLSIKYSHPEWLAQYVIDKKGYAFSESFLAANNQTPKLTIQVNLLKISTEEYARMLDSADIPYRIVRGLLGCIELENGKTTSLPGFDDGLFYVQDRAARTAVDIVASKPGMKVLDACSSPGGKSFAAAISMENRGSILSCDIHEKKLGLVQSGAQRLGINIISTEARDARENVDEFHDAFDLVIVDVPCSGLGVIRKKPEIRNKDFSSLAGLPIIQRDIINNLANFVKPGGSLLYSTCTILEEENEAIVTEFLSNRPDFELQSFSIDGINCDRGMYTFWPNVDGTDGFFVAKLIRKE